jgi:hypothetical protein
MHLRALLLAGSILGVAAACGGDENTAAPVSSVSSSASPVTASAEQLQAYRQCLVEQGIGLGGRNQGAGQGGQGSVPQGTGQGAGGQGGPRISIDPAVLQKAQEACKSKLPAGLDPATALGRGQGAGGQGAGGQGAGGQGAGGQGANARLAQFQPYLTCMRDNGVDIPERPLGGGQGGQGGQAPASPPSSERSASSTPPGGGRGGQGAGGILGQIDRESPVFVAAHEKCKVLLPEGVPLPGAGGGRTDGGSTTSTTAKA